MKPFKLVTDYACPFCYLATLYLNSINEEEKLNFEHIIFQLNPNAPKEGDSLSNHYSEEYVISTLKRLNERGASYGLEMKEKAGLFNTNLAHKVALYMHEKDKYFPYSLKVFAAYFEKLDNVADEKVLKSIVESLEEKWDLAYEFANSSETSKKFEADQALIRNKGISTVPTIIKSDESLIQSILNEEDLLNRLED